MEKGERKEEMKGAGSAIQHQRKSTGDSWRVATSQAVGLDHIRESTDTKAKSSLCPWHCCPECQKCLLLLFCWFSTVGCVPDEKTPSPAGTRDPFCVQTIHCNQLRAPQSQL